MPDDLFGELQQRHPGDADGIGWNRLNLRGMERSLLRYRKLLGDDERGAVGNGDV